MAFYVSEVIQEQAWQSLPLKKASGMTSGLWSESSDLFVKVLWGTLTGLRQKYSSSLSSSNEESFPLFPPEGDEATDVGDRSFFTSPMKIFIFVFLHTSRRQRRVLVKINLKW